MTNRTAATRYARALFDVALKERADLQAIDSQLAAFAGLFRQHPALERVLLNPAVPVPRKRAAVAEILRVAPVSPILGKLLLMLAERDRLVLIPDLLETYRDRLLVHLNVVRAAVTTSAPLEPGRADAIQQKLSQATGRTVTMTTEVDPGIIGGMVARIGSTVYDASITTQLQKMKTRLTERV